MIRKLQFLKTAVLSAFLLGGANLAWAVNAWDNTSPVYNPETGTSSANLNAAMSEITAGTSESPKTCTLYIYKDVTLGTAANSSISVPNYVTLNIEPQANVKLTRGSHTRGNRWFLVNQSHQTLNIGSDTYSLTVEDDGSTVICNTILRREAGIITVKNVTFNKIKFGDGNTSRSEYGYIYSTKSNAATGYCSFKDVTISNCSTSTSAAGAFLSSQVTTNDAVILVNAPTFTDCTGTDIYTAGRIKVLSPSTFSSSKAIDVYTTIELGQVVILGKNSDDTAPEVVDNIISQFNLVNDDKGLLKGGSGHTHELQATEAYTLSVNSYGAATLVLPFASTIPTGVSAYKLSYTAGANKVTANEVETTLPANTPVLINAAEGSHKFVSTTKVETATTGSGTPTVGALVGTYTNDTSAEGNYVLYADADNEIGFYKAGSGVTIDANRAYLKADGGSLSRLSIAFSDDETTGIDSVVKQDTKTADNVYYNLSGQRVANPSKGLYIVNGKKVIIK